MYSRQWNFYNVIVAFREVFFVFLLLIPIVTSSQSLDSSPDNDAPSIHTGQRTLMEQCFRCHGDGMWRDIKTDRDGWLSVIYRMVGRGGKWTPEQITVMADYLTDTYPQRDKP
jgi:hypothetical protein